MNFKACYRICCTHPVGGRTWVFTLTREAWQHTHPDLRSLYLEEFIRHAHLTIETRGGDIADCVWECSPPEMEYGGHAGPR